MSWPEHSYVSAILVLRAPSEREDALRTVSYFQQQKWPVKQLVIVNATAELLVGAAPNVKEIQLTAPTLGDLKNAAVFASSGEWCLPLANDCYYGPDYFTVMMAQADPRHVTVLDNPIAEDAEQSRVETTRDSAAFIGFFRLNRQLPRYEADGSDLELAKKFEAVRSVRQVGPIAVRYVSSTKLMQLGLSKAPKIRKRAGSVVIVQLGRYGDIVNSLPIALHIHNTYGKPYYMVCRGFADIFDGISYVEPFVVDLKDNDLNAALALAHTNFEHVIQTQIWGANYHQEKTVQAYNQEAWRIAGFLPKFTDTSWRPVFDKAKFTPVEDIPQIRLSGKPLMLTNLTCGASSPFEEGPQLLKAIIKLWGREFQVLDIGSLRLPHIYDLFPLIDRAALLISIDTVHLHMAAMTATPVVALVNPHEWLGTLCRCNVVRHLTYKEVVAHPQLVHDAISIAIKTKRREMPPAVQPKPAPERKIFHVIAEYEEPVLSERKRKQFAKDSWAWLYKSQGVIPAYYTDWKRTLAHINTKAKLPYFKDLLGPALELAGDDDILAYTNDDIIIHPELPDQLRYYCSIWGCVSERRCEGNAALPLNATPEQWRKANDEAHFEHYGRDLFAFTKRWILSVWDELPDFVIGSTDWDNCVVALMRRTAGIETTPGSFRQLVWPVEMPVGFTCHIWHKSMWQTFGNYWSSPGNVHNRKLFRAWAEKHAPKLKFDKDSLLQ